MKHWLLVSCLIAGTPTADYWRAKVATSLLAPPVVQHVPDAGKKVDTTPQPPKVTKPVVRMKTATWCGPCKIAKAEIDKAVNLPFVVELDDVSDGGFSGTIPEFSWDSPQGRMSFSGWYGIEHLKSEWVKTTQTKPVASQQPTLAQVLASRGVDVRGLTAVELSQAAEALRRGASIRQINDYIAAERRRQGR